MRQCPVCDAVLDGAEAPDGTEMLCPWCGALVRTDPVHAGSPGFAPEAPAAVRPTAVPSRPAAVEPTAWQPPLAPDAVRYRSAAGPARVLRPVFVAWVLLAAAAAASSAVEFRLLSRLIDAPGTVTVEQLLRSDDRQRVFAVAWLLLMLATAVLFIVWTRRVYRNVGALGGRRRFSPGWAVGAWFVPFLNLVRPKQVLDDAWRANDPSCAPGEPTAGRSVSWVLHAWWTAWVIGAVAGGILAAGGDADDLESLRTSALLTTMADVTVVVGAVLAYVVVTRLTDRQDAYAAMHPSPESAPSSPSADRSGVTLALLPIAGFVALVGGFVAFDEPASGDGGPTATRDAEARITSAGSVLLDDLVIGDCFNVPYDEGHVLSVTAVPCEDLHDAEAYAVVSHSGSGPFPGDTQVFEEATALCSVEFEGFVGLAQEESELNTLAIYPTMQSWVLGDRTSTCAVYRLDLGKLRGTARGIGM